jgi:hypothetical protein
MEGDWIGIVLGVRVHRYGVTIVDQTVEELPPQDDQPEWRVYGPPPTP